MSSILFVTWDGGGNVAPALGIAAQLQHRGHHVRVLGYAQQRGAVESAGLRFEPYRHVRTWSATTPAAAPRWAFNFMATFTDRGAGRDLVDAVQREPVDAVVVDCMMLGALKAAQKLGLRRAALVHTMYQYVIGAWRRGPLTPVAAMKGLSPLPLWSAADRVLVTTLPELEPARDLPANVRVTGPVWPVGSPSPVPHEDVEPRVLVSLSSIHYGGQVRTLQSIVDALADVPAEAILTTGHAVAPEQLRAPTNVDVHRFLPHAEVMPKVTLLVGHGGHSTTMQALAHDLPMVVMPLHPMLDHPMIGAILKERGVATVVKKSAPPERIREAVLRMLSDGPHRRAAAELGRKVRSGDGAIVAADELEELTRR